MQVYNVAVVGATGLVGRKMIQVLEDRRFPISELRLFASPKSLGKTILFRGISCPVEQLNQKSFENIHISLFSAGAHVSEEYAPIAVTSGAFVIDNSSAFRLSADVPLVVPEVNAGEISMHKGIIANPNCSTIQMVVALYPLHERWKIRRIVVSTYQSVSGAGMRAVHQLQCEVAKEQPGEKKFPHQIAYNVLPHIDVFQENSYSKEEIKIVKETQKIMRDDSIKVTATCVRVPVIDGHAEAVNVEFEKPFRLEDVYETLRNAPGVCVQDDIHRSVYPMPILSHEKDEVFVGRIRRDTTINNGLNLWIVADNLRKGAATNVVQIAEEWSKRQN